MKLLCRRNEEKGEEGREKRCSNEELFGNSGEFLGNLEDFGDSSLQTNL